MLLFYLSLIESEADKLKFEKLYYEYKSLMKYYANDMLKGNGLEEDAVHEAFIKLTRHLDGIEEIVSHKTKSFIVIVIRSVCLDMIEKEKRVKFYSFEDVEDECYVNENFLESIEAQELYAMIKLLPPIHKDIIELKISYEKSDKEIADILGISNQAVRKRLQRARNAFKKLLSDRGES